MIGVILKSKLTAQNPAARPVSYLSGVLELEHAGVIVRFPGSCFGGTNEVAQSLGHIFHCIDQDHLQSTEHSLI